MPSNTASTSSAIPTSTTTTLATVDGSNTANNPTRGERERSEDPCASRLHARPCSHSRARRPWSESLAARRERAHRLASMRRVPPAATPADPRLPCNERRARSTIATDHDDARLHEQRGRDDAEGRHDRVREHAVGDTGAQHGRATNSDKCEQRACSRDDPGATSQPRASVRPRARPRRRAAGRPRSSGSRRRVSTLSIASQIVVSCERCRSTSSNCFRLGSSDRRASARPVRADS